MNRIKVLYVITGLNVGGAERLLIDTVRSLDPERFEPVVVTLVGGVLSDDLRHRGVRVLDAGMSRRWPLPGAWRLWRIIKDERPDVVHTHLIHADFFGRVAGRLCRVPVIITTVHMIEDARRKFPYHVLDRFSARFNTALIAVSERVREQIIELERLDPQKITVIRNAVCDIARVPAQAAGAPRSGLPVSADTIVIGVVSRLEVPRKGHQVLFQALSSLVRRWPELHCLVVGDGAGRKGLQEDVRDRGLDRHVSFVGMQRDVAAWLAAMDIFVLPSLHEGLPMAVIEAMAMARPIVATRVGGVGELIRPEQEGLLVEPGQVRELAQAIERFLRDPALRGRLGQAARQRFEEHFEIHHVAEATQDLYDRCLRRQGLPRRVRLLEVVTDLDPGGVPRHFMDLVGSLSSDIFEIGVVTGENDERRVPRTPWGHYHVDMVKPIAPWADLKALAQMVRLFRNLRPDIVHSHMSKANCLASIAGRLAGVPCVTCTLHGRTLLTERISLKQVIFDLADFISLRFFAHGTISVSQATTRHLIRWRKVRAERNVTITNGIAPWPKSGESREEIRRRLGFTVSQPIVLMTGRLAQPKQPETLIGACALLQSRFPDLVCLIAGDGPRSGELETLVEHCRLDGRVRLLGHRHDIPELLRIADVFVLSSWQEGLSIAVLEAMAAGLPVVASRVPGMDEVVVDGETGILMTPGSVAECAEALQTLWLDDQKRRAMGEAGRRRFEGRFSLQRQIRRTQAVLAACGRGGFPRNVRLAESGPLDGEDQDNLSVEHEEAGDAQRVSS